MRLAAWGMYGARADRRGACIAVLVAMVMPLVASLVTYTFVSLPGNGIALDHTGSLVALLVLLKIFVLGITHHLPFDLDRLWRTHMRERRGLPGLPYLLQEGVEEDLPCTVRILCELETAARTSAEEVLTDTSPLHYGEVDARGQTEGNGDRLDGTLLEVDHVADFHEEAVAQLFKEDERGRAVLSLLAGLTGPGLCEAAYAHCPGSLTARQALGVLFRELHITLSQPTDTSTLAPFNRPATVHPFFDLAVANRNQTSSTVILPQ
ncbi:uncharacterized protein LOC126984650 [Eriocheir sinensis]|uniref:uncharacterized protein LOC126984650 n=1 Tax=Eriocheir sinensis TaxID=95602 RepID=UPI0021C98C74|nr:uncharacterized protein LOC126984650 [Eriocheir sinensis]